jgi:hypothetical protein
MKPPRLLPARLTCAPACAVVTVWGRLGIQELISDPYAPGKLATVA